MVRRLLGFWCLKLKARLKDRGLSATGKKQALVMRLLGTDDMGQKPSRKEATKTLTNQGAAAKDAAKPPGAKTAGKKQESSAQLGKGFGAVAKPKSRVVRSIATIDAEGSGSANDVPGAKVLEVAQGMAAKENASNEAELTRKQEKKEKEEEEAAKAVSG